MSRHPSLALLLVLAIVPRAAIAVEFERIVIDNDFPGAYQVEVADVNGDGKPDVVAVGGGTCACYENPTWKKRIVTGPKQSPGIISSATADLDGDGKAEIAIAYEFSMNEPTKGKLLLATQGKTPDDDWSVTPIDDVPSIHRLRWGAIHGPTPHDLVVAPLFGARATPPLFDQDPADLRVYARGRDRKAPDRWTFDRLPGGGTILHAIEVRPGPPRLHEPRILAASSLGVMAVVPSVDPQGTPSFAGFDLYPIPAGSTPAAKRGSSEVHLGRLADGREFLATIEPWHGTNVVVRSRIVDPPTNMHFGPRQVIDATLKEGHALWVSDVDGDGSDEIFAGYRGPGTSVLLYDHDGKDWTRTVVDSDIAAQDLRGGDLDGDGRPDVVAVGGKTHNVVWYRPKSKK